MNTWIDATEALPAEREYIRFVVVGHRRSLTGIYENQLFCSRWGSYEPTKVELWRKLGSAPRAPRRLGATGDARRDVERPARGRTVSLATAAARLP